MTRRSWAPACSPWHLFQTGSRNPTVADIPATPTRSPNVAIKFGFNSRGNLRQYVAENFAPHAEGT
jgi:hypothetical protein